MEAAWTRRRFYTPNEIKVHNTEEDCWVSALGKVLDLTSLIQQYRGALTEPIGMLLLRGGCLQRLEEKQGMRPAKPIISVSIPE